MTYESPTIELLGDYEMDRVQGEGVWIAVALAAILAAAAKYVAAANIVIAANVAAIAHGVWIWNVASVSRRR